MNQQHTLTIANTTIPYQLTTSPRSKHIRISISIDGLKVSKPKRVGFDEVEKLLQSKANWIYKHHMQFQAAIENQHSREWRSGEEILYKGNSCKIEIYAYDGKKTAIKFDGQKFTVHLNKALSDEEKKSSIEDQFKKWLIDSARESFEESLKFYSKKMGLSFNRFSIREQKTRWGSCSKKGNLNFNWKLIMAPQWVLNYVVIHELCHLRHLNHSKEFWNMVASYMPEHKTARQWLKQNGMRLAI